MAHRRRAWKPWTARSTLERRTASGACLVDNFDDHPELRHELQPPVLPSGFFKSRGYQVYYEQYRLWPGGQAMAVQAPFERKRAQIEARGGYRVITANDLNEARLARATFLHGLQQRLGRAPRLFQDAARSKRSGRSKTLKPVMDKDIIFFVLTRGGTGGVLREHPRAQPDIPPRGWQPECGGASSSSSTTSGGAPARRHGGAGLWHRPPHTMVKGLDGFLIDTAGKASCRPKGGTRPRPH